MLKGKPGGQMILLDLLHCNRYHWMLLADFIHGEPVEVNRKTNPKVWLSLHHYCLVFKRVVTITGTCIIKCWGLLLKPYSSFPDFGWCHFQDYFPGLSLCSEKWGLQAGKLGKKKKTFKYNMKKACTTCDLPGITQPLDILFLAAK